jgi:signal transduction histidine kinase
MQRLQLAGTLASGIAHDLNDQLTLVLGNLELALDRLPDSFDAFDSLELAKTAAGRCADMSRRLLYLGRESRTGMTRVDIQAALAEAKAMLECLKPPNTLLVVDSDPDLYILGDNTQIQQVLINLGTNAFHAMPLGGELRIAAYARHAQICISFQDMGCGMSTSQQRRIFEPFYTTRTESGGSGLGLTTAKQIVESHGGIITVESEIDIGSNFTVRLPAAEISAT